WAIDHTLSKASADDYHIRIFPQEEIFKDGSEEVKSDRVKWDKTTLDYHYVGNKWGGKYLRAPDIYYTIMEKGKNKLTPLRCIAEIRPGCYSGVNDFFYLSRETIDQFGIENQFLMPIIRTSRDIDKLYIKPSKIEYRVFACHLAKKELKKKNLNGTLQYISWGERQVTRERQKVRKGICWPETETVKRRTPGWWAIPQKNLIPTHNFMLYVINDRFLCPYSEKMIVSDRCFHRIFPNSVEKAILLAALLNSTLAFFFISLLGRWNLG
ncbi:unnamed protein product, partial [marine sediment metagenome]